VKVLASDRSGLFATMAAGVDWAVGRGANIITVSAGGTQNDLRLSNSVMNAISSGVTFIAAAHNDGSTIRFPARLPGVIAVGATTATDRRASFSNFGPELSLVAPGTNIYSISRNGRTQREWGTSLAAPQVAGAAALLLSIRSDLGPTELRELLCAGADDRVGAVTEDVRGFDRFHGFGRLNIAASLTLASTRLHILHGPGVIEIHWDSPDNAWDRQPFRVETAISPFGPWEILAVSVPNINNGKAAYAVPGGDSSRFFRVRIQAGE
jgi:serine protease